MKKKPNLKYSDMGGKKEIDLFMFESLGRQINSWRYGLKSDYISDPVKKLMYQWKDNLAYHSQLSIQKSEKLGLLNIKGQARKGWKLLC